MPHLRPASWAALAGGLLFAAPPAAAPARQQKDDEPKRPAAVGELPAYRTAAGIPAADLEKAKKAFAAYAGYVAEYVAWPRVYTAPQEFRSDPLPKGSPRPPAYTIDTLIVNLVDQNILVPVPGNPVGPDNADYIREVGAALDAALGPLPKSGDPVIGINAARVLAAACRSGAAAHYPTVTGLIKADNLPPAVKYWVFVAAHNLLAAYDLNDYRNSKRPHSVPPEVVGPLVAALQNAIENPAAILPPAVGDDGKPLAKLADDQVPVLQFVRRQAIKALGQCRLYAVPNGKQTIYPSFTLARVALSDPALPAPPSPAEAAEAVLGLCNMTPPRAQAAEPYAYAMADAIAAGLVTFATPKAARAEDKTIPWRGYAARLTEALKTWQGLFDTNYNPAQPSAESVKQAPAVAAALAGEAVRKVLDPVDGAGRFDLGGLQQYREATLRADPKYTAAPYRDNKALVLPVPK